jgi:hypothetical protein
MWGHESKRASFDAVVIRGQAPAPVYLWIKDGAGSTAFSVYHADGVACVAELPGEDAGGGVLGSAGRPTRTWRRHRGEEVVYRSQTPDAEFV